MKKCPECGNPSYDGAPVCGNCGYKFQMKKNKAPKREDIFQKPKKPKKKSSDNESVIEIINQNKLVIGAILIVTIIVICGIVLTGSNTKGTTNNLVEFNDNGLSFKHPKNWEVINGSDAEHIDAKFFRSGNNTTIEIYNVTAGSTSLKDITQQRITYAQGNGAYVTVVEPITIDGRNSSNVVLENANGTYTRFVSILGDGQIYVFKITGKTFDSVISSDIDETVKSADIK